MVNVVEHFLAQGLIGHENGQWAVRGEVQHRHVPASLRQLIAQQVERLSEEQRQVLEGASIAGAEFSVAAVTAAGKQEVEKVETICEEIAGQGHFLEERGVVEWPDGTISERYAFRHAFYQNVLSEGIAEARKIRLHRRIGERLEHGYGDRAQEVASELAVHFEEGRDSRRAARYRQQAGENANHRSAHVEAVAHFTKALALLKTLPDTVERSQQELRLQIALGTALIATKGYASPETRQAYARAHALCQQLGDTPQLFPLLAGLVLAYQVAGDLKTAHELAAQMLNLASRQQAPTSFAMAHVLGGTNAFFRGELVAAREDFEQGIARRDPQADHPQVSGFMQDPGMACWDYAAWVLWFLGYPDQALKKSQETRILARELAHPYSLAHTLCYAASLYQHRREGQRAHQQAEAAIALCNDQGFSYFLAMSTILQGWTLAEQGQREEGIVQIRQGIVSWRATGAELSTPYFLALLAEAYGRGGQAGEGLTVVAEALAIANKNAERFYEAELYRLKGELTLQQSKASLGQVKTSQDKSEDTDTRPLNSDLQGEAEACFLKAIEIAQRQQAKSLELRAAMSLVRLRQLQALAYASRNTDHVPRAKLDEAHLMLSKIYGWFTEGFDTADLQEAKALLEELSGN
ncbi:MAG: hypothetical protein AB7P18_13430 [Candidatus Binatia bacterium]